MTSQHATAMGAPGGLDHCPIMPTYGAPSVMFVRGEGCRLWDREGRDYLDFLSGLAVTSLGHSHPAVAEAVADQARTLVHVSNLFGTEHNADVALTLDRLIRSGHPDGGDAGQVFFANSGAEANECALKLARKWGGRGRHVVVSAMRSFHGRTLATLHATGQPEKHEPFQPLPEGFRHVAFDDVAELERALDDTVAAVLLEAVQGEGGVNPAGDGYFAAVRRLCDERNILLMLDEVQTGLARTGRWFAHHRHGIVPDVITMAKALGNGVPIGACWARREVAAAFSPGDHATTYGGQPLATAAARAVLATMEAMDAPAVAERAGQVLRAGLAQRDWCAGVRGEGLLLAVELTPEALGGRTGAQVAATCLERGLVLNGVSPTALRLAPPLIVSDDDIQQALSLLDTVLGDTA